MSTTLAASRRPPTAALAACLADPVLRMHGSPVAAVRRAPSRYSTSFLIDDLTVRLGDGTDLGVIYKNLSPDGLLPGAGSTRPAGVFEPGREIDVYRFLLPAREPGAPDLIAWRADPEINRYWLFLERVDGQELYQVGDLGVWLEAARWIGRFHRGGRPPSVPGSLLRLGPRWYRRWMERAVEFAAPETRSAVERLAAVHPEVVRALGGLPDTLIHGDFYASNVLAARSGGRLRICPVDWERAAIGPGLFDLASLVAGWPPEGAGAMATAYGGVDPRDLDMCRLQLCIQWLGWSRAWEPPPEHRQDWLREANRLARGLGLL